MTLNFCTIQVGMCETPGVARGTRLMEVNYPDYITPVAIVLILRPIILSNTDYNHSDPFTETFILQILCQQH